MNSETKQISRVELFCDDAAVGKIQRLLAGIKGVYDVRTVPVINAVAKANGVHAQSDGNLIDQLMAHLAKTGAKEIRPQEAADWLEKSGYSRQSSSYVLRSARDAGYLTKKGASSKTSYVVKS
jgi:hypothetical protein